MTNPTRCPTTGLPREYRIPDSTQLRPGSYFDAKPCCGCYWYHGDRFIDSISDKSVQRIARRSFDESRRGIRDEHDNFVPITGTFVSDTPENNRRMREAFLNALRALGYEIDGDVARLKEAMER